MSEGQKRDMSLVNSNMYKLPDVSLNLDHTASTREWWCPKAAFHTPDDTHDRLTLTQNLSWPGGLDRLFWVQRIWSDTPGSSPVSTLAVIEKASRVADMSTGELEEC